MTLSSDLQELRSQFRLVRETFQKHGSYIPATLDDPPEEPQPPDMDRLDDDSNFDRRNLCVNVEESTSGGALHVDPGPILPRTERNFFKYFLDGSIRTYYLGEQLENGRSYPLIATEVASAAILRSEDGRQSVAGFKRKIALLIPPAPPMLPETVHELMEVREQMMSTTSRFKLEVVKLDAHERQEGVDLRTSLLGKARAEMHTVEHDLAHQIKRSEEEWLVLDGAIRKHEFLGLKETIGLAKSFSRNPIFRTQDRGIIDVVALVSELREGQRTAVFKHESVADSESREGDRARKEVAFWYTRLRSGKGLEGPLQGVVKIDYHLEKDRLDSTDLELVNRITRALAAERYVSPYPTPRWHAHIYPIFTAENYIKASLLSPLVFRGYFGAR